MAAMDHRSSSIFPTVLGAAIAVQEGLPSSSTAQACSAEQELKPSARHDGSFSNSRSQDVAPQHQRRFLPRPLVSRVRWAVASAMSTLLISLWCLLPWTRTLLPFTTFGAFVAVFVAERSFGRVLRTSADCIFGATCAVALAWPLGRGHGQSELLAAAALFLQCFFWSYLDLPLPSKRLAMSCAVMTCLSAQRRPGGLVPLKDAVSLIAVVALGCFCALLGLVALPNMWFGPRRAAARAVTTAQEARQLGRLLLERTIGAFLETVARRQHVAEVQLIELGRAFRQSVAQLAAELDDAQWEPLLPVCLRRNSRDPLAWLRQDLCALQRLLEHCDGLQRTLTGLPFNACHAAFATCLSGPLTAVSRSVGDLVSLQRPLPSSSDVETASKAASASASVVVALQELNRAYGNARRDLLYPITERLRPEALEAGRNPSSQLAAMDTCQISWRTEDLLHMNTFLFTLMHLAGQLLVVRRSETIAKLTGPQKLKGLRIAAWRNYLVGSCKLFKPPWPPVIHHARMLLALRFAAAILLAASMCLLPYLRGRFELEIWAPVEVTFLMFNHSGGSLRQSILRLEGTLLGSIVGHLLGLFLGADRPLEVAIALALWSFVACCFRSSAAYGYAAIVAAWTAPIVVAEGVTHQVGRTAAILGTAALERMLHTSVGAGALVLVVNFIFPAWARDAARRETAAALNSFEELNASLQEAWMDRSRKMQADMSPLEEEESLLRGSANAGNVERPGSPGTPSVPCGRKVREGLLVKLGQRLVGLDALVSEACFEPAFWRPAYQAEATRRVTAILGQMLQWLRMFSTYVSETENQAEVNPVLSEVFGLEGPRRWLTKEWVASLQGTNEEISATLSGLSQTLQETASRPQSGSCLGICFAKWRDRLSNDQSQSARVEQLYMFAMRIQSLETSLRRELGRFLARYDWILSGTITESQLKILMGNRSHQLLTNLDVLFYNSLVFTTRGFVEQLLNCSKAVRELATAEAGITDAGAAMRISALCDNPAQLEQRIFGASQEGRAVQISTEPLQNQHSINPSQATGDPAAHPQVDLKRLVMTVVGPDRLGIVHDISRIVFELDGSVAASRMAKLDDFFAVVMQLVLPASALTTLDKNLSIALPGLQVSIRVATEKTFEHPPFQAEVHCVCPQDAPGLLMQLTSVLTDSGLNVLLLDTELRRMPTGQGFVMRALVGADEPVDETRLQARFDALREGASLGVAAQVSVAVPFRVGAVSSSRIADSEEDVDRDTAPTGNSL